MNAKEVSELRRHFHPDKSNITSIRGCYVNENKEIIAEINDSLTLMPENESEKLLSILRRTLSGTINRNLINIEFETTQVLDSKEHKLLMELRESKLSDTDLVQTLFDKIIETVDLEGNYVILLTKDTYDVPYRSSSGERQDDMSTEVFNYILCSICPIKRAKPALSYQVHENKFHSIGADWIVSPPELGFMFPAFDDRKSNIYGSLYYTRNIKKSYDEFVDKIFKCEIPMPAATQKEVFGEIMTHSLGDNCNLEILQSVNTELQEIIEIHKENKEVVPLTISKDTVKQVLNSQGIPKESIEAFDREYDEVFGAETSISPRNIINSKRMEVDSTEVSVRINTSQDDLVKTRVIDGKKYLLIRVEDGVEINGIPVHIN